MSFSRPSLSKSVKEREVTLEDIKRELKGVDFSKTIPKVEYESTNLKAKKSISPTASEMLGVRDFICMI